MRKQNNLIKIISRDTKMELARRIKKGRSLQDAYHFN